MSYLLLESVKYYINFILCLVTSNTGVQSFTRLQRLTVCTRMLANQLVFPEPRRSNQHVNTEAKHLKILSCIRTHFK